MILNWIVLIVGLILIGLFWNKIASPDRKKETQIVTIVFLVLGIVVYFLQTTLL